MMNERIQPLIDVITNVTDVVEHDGELDIPDLIFALKALIPGPDFEALALSFDMCPIHNQDLDSCADDDTDNDENEIEGMQPLNTPVLAACRHLRTRTRPE